MDESFKDEGNNNGELLYFSDLREMAFTKIKVIGGTLISIAGITLAGVEAQEASASSADVDPLRLIIGGALFIGGIVGAHRNSYK